jgi:hypothetical protein
MSLSSPSFGSSAGSRQPKPSISRGAAAEVERLGNIIEDTARWLREKKHHGKAKELLSKLGERPRKPRPLTLEQMTAQMQKQSEESRDSW